MEDSFKPVSLGSAIRDAHQRIDYLCKICQLLVLAAAPDERRHYEDLLRAATRHGVDPESDNG